MFDIGWSELLIVGVVALLVIGPKDLPVALRTLGKYMGLVRRQAAEFRTQFDEAMREAEMDQLRKEVGDIKSGIQGTLQDTMREAERSFESATSDKAGSFESVAIDPRGALESAGGDAAGYVNGSSSSAHADPDAHDADGIPIAPPPSAAAVAAAAAAAHIANGTTNGAASPLPKTGA